MKISLFFFIFFSPFLLVDATVPTKLNLSDAIRYAVEHAPQFDSIKKKISISEAEEKNAFYKFFPSLDLSATHGIQGSDPKLGVPGEPAYSSTALSLTQPLYDNGVSSTGYKAARLTLQQAQLEFNEQKNKLCLDVEFKLGLLQSQSRGFVAH